MSNDQQPLTWTLVGTDADGMPVALPCPPDAAREAQAACEARKAALEAARRAGRSQARIGIIGALEQEVALIAESLENTWTTKAGGIQIISGALGDREVLACVAGMGTVNVAAATQQLIALGARTVIFSGIAGSLNPALHIEDVVIGQTLRYVDTDTAIIAESAPGLEEFHSTDWLVDLAAQALLARGYTELPAEKSNNCADGGAPSSPAVTSAQGEQQFLVGTISTGNRFVTGPLKAQVLEATHADCAEMEGAAVAHVCAKNGVDCLVLRAISDNCDEAYDAFSSRVFDIEEYARSASALVLDILGSIDAHAKN